MSEIALDIAESKTHEASQRVNRENSDEKTARCARPFIRMPRGWMDDELFGDEPLCKRAAWAWLVEDACWKPRKKRIDGKTVQLQRGELTHSLRFLAQAWGWGHERVRRFLRDLVEAGHIKTRCETRQTIITICNYGIIDDTSETARQDARRHRDDVETDSKKERREEVGRESGDRTESSDRINESERRPQPSVAGVDPPQPNSKYAFIGRIIRLNHRDFAEWRTIYHAIPDIVAELRTLDGYYDRNLKTDKERREWFSRCSSALLKKHQGYVAEAKERANPPPRKRTIGIG